MGTEPLISIIICTHNREESLKKYLLESLLRLNYSNYEVIFVDDASTDKTQVVLREFKDKLDDTVLLIFMHKVRL